MKVTIFHNPRCSKSRAALALLRGRGIEPRVVEYLKRPPDAAALDAILRSLGMEPRELMRTQEAPYRERNLADPSLGRGALVRAMVEDPILIERPIVLRGKRAALGRPPENVLGIL